MRYFRPIVGTTALTALIAASALTVSTPVAQAVDVGRAAPIAPTSKLVKVTPSRFVSRFERPSAASTPKPRVAPASGRAAVRAGLSSKVGGFTLTLSAGSAVARSTSAPAARQAATVPVTVSTSAGAVHATIGAPRTGARWSGRVTMSVTDLVAASGGSADRLAVIDSTACGSASTSCPRKFLTTSRDLKRGTLSFAARSGSSFTVAAVANGSGGDYSATSLNPASSWGVSEQFGSFTWSYPMRVPPAASGLGPDLTLGYDSGSVDGRVASTNNQPSWVGEGFDLAPGGYVTREYQSCGDDMTGGSNATRKTGDLCWGKDNATLVLNGKASRLVRDGATANWRLKEDDGSTIQRLSGAGNGDDGKVAADTGEYWVLTDTDGTKYYFGLEKRYTGDTTVRNSTLTVPVNGNHSGEQCYNATFASGFCAQAWKWQLSYVKDLRGNTITYNYAKEPNRYGQNNATTSVGYDRAGYLASIEYGQVTGSETAANTQQRVIFDVAERCIPSGSITCDPAQLTAANAAYWPDVPQDQICTATCTAGQTSPSFFTRKRLVAVRTEVLKGSTFSPVEKWTFAHSFPASGDATPASLALDSITHTGQNGGTTATPPVLFSRTQLQNRVDVGANDGDATMIKWRVSSIETESGGVISVNYKSADCATGSLPSSPDANTRRCYPNYWSPPGATNPVLGWFHKYVVDSVVADGGVAPSQATVTRYSYLGTPAWHYDDNVMQPAKYRTWSEFRGYANVDTVTGEVGEPNPLRERATFFRGMNGDNLAAGGTKTAVVTDSTGGTATDSDWFNGLSRESITYNGTDEVSGQISTPWASAATATDTFGAARIVRDGATVTARTAREGTTPYTTQTVTTFDANGNATQVSDLGDTARADDNRCTTTTYVANATLNLQGLPATSKTVAIGCGVTPGASDITSETNTLYDGATTVTATPTRGEVTKTAVRADSGMVTASTTSYDSVGRVLDVTDILGRKTSTTYTPATNAATTSTKVTDPKTFTVTTTMDPAYGIPTKVVDTNTRTTTITNDPLGRKIKVWLANRATTQSPSYQYDYLIRQDGPSAVTTSTLHYLGVNRITSTTLFDGLMRQVQTQTQSGAGSRVINETIYDNRGLAKAVRGPWVSTGLPTTTAVTAPDASVDTVVTTAYDGAARPTKATTFVYATEKWHTDTVYHGDSIDTLPPAGGVATRTITDARGHQTALWQYHGSTVTAAKDVTAYTYNNKDQLTQVVNQPGMTWTYGYNQLGQQTASTDPDKGATSTVYDLAGNITKTTDAEGRIVNRTWDELNRPLSVTDGAGTLLTQYTYDTVTSGKGQLATASSFAGGAEYKNAVDAYDAVYHAKGNTITIPASETGLSGTYTYTRNYNVDGSLGYVNMPGVANMPAEQYAYQRDATNLPKNLLGQPSGVLAGVVRDGFGRVTQYTLQALDVGTYVTNTYEPGTGRLSNQRIDRDNVATPDINATFGYDDSGRITTIADVPDASDSSRTDRQCFQYSWAGELTEAWANGDTTCAASPSLATTGASPYWTSWGYDAAHRRASQTQHGAAADTTATYSYPAVDAVPNGTTGGPHAATSISTQIGAGTPTVASLSFDKTGNTKSTPVAPGATGTATWDAQGRLATFTQSGQTAPTSQVYDADGSLLIRRDPSGKKTLYLGGDTEVSYTPGDGASPASTSAMRYYTFEGRIVAYRKGPNPGDLVNQPPGYQGTSLVQTDGEGGSYALRRFDPFGNPRGNSAGATWVGNRGFLGATGATAGTSGLVHLGAREYNSATGSFLSVDPLMDLTDPTQWNAYSYAQNSPITLSDPDGNRPIGAYDDEGEAMTTVGGKARGSGGSTHGSTRRSIQFWSSLSPHRRAGYAMAIVAQRSAIRDAQITKNISTNRAGYNPYAGGFGNALPGPRPPDSPYDAAVALGIFAIPFVGACVAACTIIGLATAAEVAATATLEAAGGSVGAPNPLLSGVGTASRTGGGAVRDGVGIPSGSTADAATSGGRITASVRSQYFHDGAEPPACSYCRQSPAEHLDHVIPRVQGGDLSPENLTPACAWCNLSKGARVAPVNPPAGYVGEWPPSFWPARMSDWWLSTYSGSN